MFLSDIVLLLTFVPYKQDKTLEMAESKPNCVTLLTISEESALTEAGISIDTLSVFHSLARNVSLSMCISSTLICILIALKLAQIFGASTVSGER